jgi:hypothetical protein
MRANVDTGTPGMERCVSCEASLSGPYCSRCGEHALEPEALTLRHFLVHTVAHELLDVDAALAPDRPTDSSSRTLSLVITVRCSRPRDAATWKSLKTGPV